MSELQNRFPIPEFNKKMGTKPTLTKQPYEDLNLEEIEEDTTIVMFGPRGVGKTTLVYKLLLALKLSRGMIKCKSGECWQNYSEWISKPYIYQGFFPEKLSRVMMYQNNLMSLNVMEEYKFRKHELASKIRAQAKQHHTEKFEKLVAQAEKGKWDIEYFKKEHAKREKQWAVEEDDEFENVFGKEDYKMKRQLRKPYCMFVVLDDLASDGSLNHKLVKVLVNNGRHMGILVFFAIQDPVDLPPRYRQGMSWIFLFYDIKKPNLENLFKSYASSLFKTINDLRVAMKWAKERGGVLVLHVNHREQHLLHRSVFFWKSGKMPYNPQAVGSHEFMQLGNQWLDVQKHKRMVQELMLNEEDDKKKGRTKRVKEKVKTDDTDQKDKEDNDEDNEYNEHNEENEHNENDHQDDESMDQEDDNMKDDTVNDTMSDTMNDTNADQRNADESRNHLADNDDEKDNHLATSIRHTQKQLRKEGRRAKRVGDLEQDLFNTSIVTNNKLLHHEAEDNNDEIQDKNKRIT
jgi:hypothetical protein